MGDHCSSNGRDERQEGCIVELSSVLKVVEKGRLVHDRYQWIQHIEIVLHYLLEHRSRTYSISRMHVIGHIFCCPSSIAKMKQSGCLILDWWELNSISNIIGRQESGWKWTYGCTRDTRMRDMTGLSRR